MTSQLLDVGLTQLRDHATYVKVKKAQSYAHYYYFTVGLALYTLLFVLIMNLYFDRWTIGLLSTVSLFSIVFNDLGFVNSFFGALIANSIIYIFPSLMTIAPIRRSIPKGLGHPLSRARCVSKDMYFFPCRL